MRQTVNTAPLRLNSWKEIASYLDRGVRTVQRWERELQLPVHRIGKGKRSPVYSTSTELNFWLNTSGVARSQPPQLQLIEPARRTGDPVEDSRRLLVSVRTLALTIAETSVRQRQQAEILQARILQIRSRMK